MSRRRRVAFFGTPEPAVPSLRAFLDDPGFEVAAVVTNPDRPRGRGHRLAPPPVKVAASGAGVPVWQPPRPREIVDDLRALEVDACAIVAYGSILRPDVLAAGGRGFVNLHFSLLPAWRGAAPVPAALLAGDDVVGVSCFVLDEGMDTGPLLLTERTRVRTGETAGELTARLAQLGGPALVRAVAGFVDGTLVPQPQDDDRATYASKVAPHDAAIDWTADADTVERMVRAYNPVPGAHTTFQGARLKLHRVRPVRPPSSAGGLSSAGGASSADGSRPGAVVRVDRKRDGTGGPVVACGEGAVRLDEVQPAGKPRMTGLDFVNGYRPEGAVLGH